MKKILLLTACVMLPLSAQAEDGMSIIKSMMSGGNQNCKIKETVSISISFNNQKVDAAQIKTMFDSKLEEIKALSKEAGIDTLNISNMNYSLYPQNSGSNEWSAEPPKIEYQFNGSMSLSFEPADKATAFMELLGKKRYQANLSYNAYKESCQ